MDDCALFLKKSFPQMKIQADYSLAKRSCIGCGGNAKFALFPNDEKELAALLGVLQANGFSYRVLGNLSNVLPPDGEYPKIPILTECINQIKIDGDEVYAGAGTSSGKLLRFCKERGLVGGEFLTGIPCFVGGATYMNAGVRGAYMQEIVSGVLVYVDGQTVKLTAKECQFSYKNSLFMHRDAVILGVYLKFKQDTPQAVEKAIAEYAQNRKNLPVGKSMGCVFKNPQGGIAGKLIEGAGLKGLTLGGATISEKHANFILNENACKSSTIKTLILLIKDRVQAEYGIRLQEEIIYI